MVSDRQAEAAVRWLAEHGVVSGESGAATLAGLVEATWSLDAGAAPLADQTVLLLSTEGLDDDRVRTPRSTVAAA